jgi:hypothetical protein
MHVAPTTETHWHFFPTWASPEFHYLRNEITKFTSSRQDESLLITASNSHPDTKGPLKQKKQMDRTVR